MSDANDFYERLNDTLKDPDQCYLCENAPAEETHHILPQRFNGSDAEDNVVDLCHDCHWKLERLYNKDFYNALGIEDPRQTQEKHIVCYWKDCYEQAVEKGQYQSYYCEEHIEGREMHTSRQTSTDDDVELKSVGGNDE